MSKTWLITGSSRGLGRALAQAVLEAGDHLIATARSPEALADLVERHGSSIRAVALDVTDPVAAAGAVRMATETFGGLDVLVNNAGYGDIGSVEDTSLEEFRRQIETNLFGTIIVTKAALPFFRERKAGHIIQFSSVGGRVGAPGRAPYSAAKSGVEGFSESLAREVGPIGIKVTIVEPGGFRTDFAGASTTINSGRPEYDAVVGAAARMQRAYDGKQPGNPARAASAILRIAGIETPPLRLLLGSDAVRIVEAADRAKLDEIEAWRELSLSTDFQVISNPAAAD